MKSPNYKRKLQNRATVSSQKHELSEGVIGASLLTVGIQNPREDAHRMKDRKARQLGELERADAALGDDGLGTVAHDPLGHPPPDLEA